MGLAQSPRITTDGLVFYYDQNNVKSFVGPPIQNLASTIAFNNRVGTGISFVGGNEDVSIPQIGVTNVAFNNLQNNYTVFVPNSNDCCPNPFRYTGDFGGGGFAVSPSTLYTYSIVYKVNSGYTHPNYMYRYEYASNGGAYVTEGGVHSNSNRIHLGDGWYWAWGTFTTAATTNWIAYAAAFYYRYSNTTDKLSIGKVLIVQGNYTGLHPRHWPSVNTTRSNTQAVLDMTKRNTVTANSLTYASDGTFSFNGSNNLINAGNNAILNVGNIITVNAWVFIGSTSSYQPIVSKVVSDFTLGWELSNSSGALRATLRPAPIDIASGALTLNSWNMTTMTFDGVTLSLYLNGIFQTSGTGGSVTLNSIQDMYIGARIQGNYFNGNISNAQVYNRSLTQAEILQNFNALRGRFQI